MDEAYERNMRYITFAKVSLVICTVWASIVLIGQSEHSIRTYFETQELKEYVTDTLALNKASEFQLSISEAHTGSAPTIPAVIVYSCSDIQTTAMSTTYTGTSSREEVEYILLPSVKYPVYSVSLIPIL